MELQCYIAKLCTKRQFRGRSEKEGTLEKYHDDRDALLDAKNTLTISIENHEDEKGEL